MHPGTTHSELFRAAYASGGRVRKADLFVQVRIQGVGVCAQVVELFDVAGVEWVKLRQQSLGVFSRPCRVVAACEGVGSCSCAGTGAVSGGACAARTGAGAALEGGR